MAKPHKWAEVIKAWADGKRIRCRDIRRGNWFTFDNESEPTGAFHADFEYEIAPEPLRGWVNVYGGGEVSGLYPSREEADTFARHDRIRCVEMVGVTNDGKQEDT